MKNTAALISGPILKGLLGLMIPLLIGNIFQQIYYITDLFLVGLVLGDTALAAVGAGVPVINLVLSVLIGTAGAFSVLLANRFGASSKEEMIICIDTCVISWLVISALTIVFGILLIDPILHATQVPDTIRPNARQYILILLLGVPGNSGYNFLSALRRGQGDAKIPLFFLILATQGNVLLDILFMVVFHWGICGAALATIVTQLLSCIGLYWYLQRRWEEYCLHMRKLRFSSSIFCQSLKIGLPSAVQQLGSNLGLVSVQGLVNSFGSDVMAGYAVVSRVDAFASLPGMSLEHTLCSFTAQNLGGGQYARTRQGLKISLACGMFIAAALCIAILACGEKVVSAFLDQAGAIAFAWNYLRIICLFYVFQIWIFCFNGYFRGHKRTIYAMAVSLCSLWLIRLPVSMLLAMPLGNGCLSWGLGLSWVAGIVVLLPYFAVREKRS